MKRRSATTSRSDAPARKRDDRNPRHRPFKALSNIDLQLRVKESLEHQDGETGAHCIHELWMRGEYYARIETALEQLWRAAAATVPEWLPMRYVTWLRTAYDVCARFEAKTRGRTNIYLVLLEYPDRRGDPHGVYVGMSTYSPAARFDQHKAGIRAAGCVLKRGVEVLTGPTLHLQRIGRAEAAHIESALAEALRDAGLRVEGGH